MKETPDLKKAHESMRPGVLTVEGFLGEDRRNLVEILIADDAKVQRQGLTQQAIADRMKELRDEGKRGLGLEEPVGDHFEVLVEEVRGGLPCPFGCPGLIKKSNTTVRNTESGERLTYTDLSIHLIEAHGFYQGAPSTFRLDPEHLKKHLEIKTIKEKPTVPNLPR